MRTDSLRPAAILGLSAVIAIGCFGFSSAPAYACSPYCNDPNWQHQERVMRQQAEQQAMMEQYYGRYGQDGTAPPPPVKPPRYVPPPPPKGWKPLYSAMVNYRIRNDEDDDVGIAHDYGLFTNYPNEAAAVQAALDHCMKHRLPDDSEDGGRYKCSGQIYLMPNAYFSIQRYLNGNFGFIASNVYEKALYNAHPRKGNGRLYTCASGSGELEYCQSYLIGVGRNGIFARFDTREGINVLPCPEGPPNAQLKVVGIDRLGDRDTPLCGPDPVAEVARDTRGLFTGVAVHPRYIIPWLSGGEPSAAAAEARAIADCNATTGGGCRALGSHVDGAIVVLRNDEGALVLGKAADWRAALSDAQQRCQPGQVIPCKMVLARETGFATSYKPAMNAELQYFGAAALPEGRVTGDRRAWIARNYATQAEAEENALRLCQAENRDRLSCRIVARGLGNTYKSWASADGSAGIIALQWKGEDIWPRFQAALDAVCGVRGAKCREGLGIGSDWGEGMTPYASDMRMEDINGDSMARF